MNEATEIRLLAERELVAEIDRRKALPKKQRGDMRELKRARNRMTRNRRNEK